jgi:hypothetical protein
MSPLKRDKAARRELPSVLRPHDHYKNFHLDRPNAPSPLFLLSTGFPFTTHGDISSGTAILAYCVAIPWRQQFCPFSNCLRRDQEIRAIPGVHCGQAS